jgi:NAD(P)-dependent dehydrogenase (short-subunit alcohol dehydrogenase family)
MTTHDDDRVALVTGGTAGLGLALTRALVDRGWRVVTDGRSGERVAAVAGPRVTALTGDVTDPGHRAELATAVERQGRLDLLVHNASTLGSLPMRELAASPDLDAVWRTNVAAPHALTVALLPWLRHSDGILLSISSDAAVEHYETWGPYGATKAALDHLTLTFGSETGLAAYAVDPGDMRTGMHQDAFPGEDIADRPLPESVVPHLLALIERRPPSGRLRAREVAA